MEAQHRLGVVVQHRRLLPQDDPQSFFVSLEVGNENLDVAIGHELTDPGDRLREDPRPPVVEIITVHAGEYGVLQTHCGNRRGGTGGLVAVDLTRPSRLDIAEGTGTGAQIAEEHQRGRALAPTFMDVRTARLLAHRVEALFSHQRCDFLIGGI